MTNSQKVNNAHQQIKPTELSSSPARRKSFSDGMDKAADAQNKAKVHVFLKLFAVVCLTGIIGLWLYEMIPNPWGALSLFVAFIGGMVYMEVIYREN